MSASLAYRALVVTASDRAAAGEYADRSGPILVAALTSWGLSVESVVVPDGEEVGAALRRAVADGMDLVLTTGGTGLGPRDDTPEQTAPLIDRPIPALAGRLVRYGVDHGVPTAVLSRGIAGLAGRTLIMNLPGSTGGVRDALAVLEPVLLHALEQVRGGDH